MIIIGRMIRRGAPEEVTSASGEQPCKEGEESPRKEKQTRKM